MAFKTNNQGLGRNNNNFYCATNPGSTKDLTPEKMFQKDRETPQGEDQPILHISSDKLMAFIDDATEDKRQYENKFDKHSKKPPILR